MQERRRGKAQSGCSRWWLPPESRIYKDRLNSYRITIELRAAEPPTAQLTLPQSHNQQTLRGKTLSESRLWQRLLCPNRCRPALGRQKWLQTLLEPHCKLLQRLGQPGSAQLHGSPVQYTSACASIATACCSGGIRCSLFLSLFQSKTTCCSLWIGIFFQVCQQNYRWADDDLCSFRRATSWMHCPATLPCTKHCLHSTPAPFPPYGLSSLLLPPCSGAFPAEARREMQPLSLPPLCSVGTALCLGTRGASLAGVNWKGHVSACSTESQRAPSWCCPGQFASTVLYQIGFAQHQDPHFLKLNVGHFTAVPSAQAGCGGIGHSRSPPLYFSFCVKRGGGREASAYLLN